MKLIKSAFNVLVKQQDCYSGTMTGAYNDTAVSFYSILRYFVRCFVNGVTPDAKHYNLFVGREQHAYLESL